MRALTIIFLCCFATIVIGMLQQSTCGPKDKQNMTCVNLYGSAACAVCLWTIWSLWKAK